MQPNTQHYQDLINRDSIRIMDMLNRREGAELQVDGEYALSLDQSREAFIKSYALNVDLLTKQIAKLNPIRVTEVRWRREAELYVRARVTIEVQSIAAESLGHT